MVCMRGRSDAALCAVGAARPAHGSGPPVAGSHRALVRRRCDGAGSVCRGVYDARRRRDPGRHERGVVVGAVQRRGRSRGASRDDRDRVLSVVSTGTTLRLLAAGLAALWVGSDWRLAWVLFASSAVAAAVPNALVLPGGVRRDASGDPVDGSGGDAGSGFYPFRPGWGWFFRSETAPLFVVALSFGIVTAFYFSFAVDLVVRSGVCPARRPGLCYSPSLARWASSAS